MRKRKLLLNALLFGMLGLFLTSCGEVNDSDSKKDEEKPVETGEKEKEDKTDKDDTKTDPIVIVNQVEIKESKGLNEGAYVTWKKEENVGYNAYVKEASSEQYIKIDNELVREENGTYRVDALGLKAGLYDFKIVPVVSGKEKADSASYSKNIKVDAYDRSGYAHFNYNEGVGAYNNDGTLKDNAIVLYVTDENKNDVTLTYKSKTVKGIGNILNSVGEKCGEAGHENECKKVSNGKTLYGKGNDNQGILKDLANDNIPLVVRFVGCISDSGLYKPATFAAKSASLIEGLTAYDAVDYGGSTGDNGHMARMKSAKNITFEGVGDNATIDGWGFHLICETAAPELAKNFEVRNLAFINTPEDAIGMEGQETESTLTITAPVERCWVHHNTFISPSISDPAESDKSEGDGSCDFKRGRYFTCSYNYFEECHKTNLVGSSKTSVQYCLSYHHNLWYNCAARQPLARQANIHFYNNLIYGTTDTVSSLRANSYMFSEANYYMGCSRVVEAKSENGVGTCKSYNNVLVGCFNNYDATVATSREQQVESAGCKDNALNISYEHFDTNPELFYYDSVNKKSDCYLTSASDARIECLLKSGSLYRTMANKCKIGISSDITSALASSTISGDDSLTISKGKNILKVFKVTAPVTITVAATSNAGFDTGYLLKMDGTLVLALSESSKTAVLENGTYVLVSSVSFTANGKNDKETTITTCSFAKYNSDEFNAKLLKSYNDAVRLIPNTITYTSDTYKLIKNAMDIYQTLGELTSEVTNYSKVTNALEEYKALGKTYVEKLINAIGTVSKSSGSAINAARGAYDELVSKFNDIVISNYQTLVSAEEAFASYAIEAFNEAVNNIGTVSYTAECKAKLDDAKGKYELLDDDQKKSVSAKYNELNAAIEKYEGLKLANDVNELIINANTITLYEEASNKYNELSTELKALINSSNLETMYKNYTIALIDSLPVSVSRADKATVELARSIYDSLSALNKALVSNIDKLSSAEAELNALPSVQVTKTLSATDFNITGASTTFNGNVWVGSSIVGISKTKYTDVSKVVLNATRYDAAVKFKVSYSTDGSNWTLVDEKQPGSNKKAEDLEYNITLSGDLYIKVEIVGNRETEGYAKQGTINEIKVSCYE